MSQKQSNIGYAMPYFDTPIGKRTFRKDLSTAHFQKNKSQFESKIFINYRY